MKYELFAEYRKRAGLTQKQVGDYVGISAQAVSKWETGQSEPDIYTLCMLAKLYNITVDELIGKESVVEEAEQKASKSEEMKGLVKKNGKKIIFITLPIVIVLSLLVAFAMIWNSTKEERLFDKYQKIELGMTLAEVEKILGKEEGRYENFTDEDANDFDITMELIEFGYIDCTFLYWRGDEYDENLEADKNFDLGYEFKPYYQIRITLDKDGNVIETYYNAAAEYLSLWNDYCSSEDKTVKTVEYLEQIPTEQGASVRIKALYEDGSAFLGEAILTEEDGVEYLAHPWGNILVKRKKEKIELGLTEKEVIEVLGEPEDVYENFIDGTMSASDREHEKLVYGYVNCRFWYWRGDEYDANQNAEQNLDYDYVFKPYYQIRVTFNENGEVIEYYNNTVSEYLAFDNDYGFLDNVKELKSFEYLGEAPTKNDTEAKVKIVYKDGSEFFGTVEIKKIDGSKYLLHPWGNIRVKI